MTLSQLIGESKTIRIGKQGTQTKTVIAGISGATVPGGVGVIIDTNGPPWHGRFLGAIQGRDEADG